MIRMLIADTHALFLDALQRLISSAHPTIHLVKVHDVAAFMRKITDETWDLIICDISLQRTNDLKLFQRIKTENPALKLYVMGIHTREHVAHKILAVGAAGYLQKETLHEDALILIEKTISSAS